MTAKQRRPFNSALGVQKKILDKELFIYIKSLKFIPAVLAVFMLGIATFMQIKGIKLNIPAAPLEWGLIKDFIDMFYVLLVPWNGWVVLAPLIFSALQGWRYSSMLYLCLACAILMGVIDTLISFETVTPERIIKGIITYIIIFGLVYITAVISFTGIKRAFNTRA
ncbi:MAG: hypothetical protein OEY61_12970 [Gammaproteobacteria bacterium]|nr:hypothetical protein [Gammaproteobacteria bacterium]